jgi:hypothetical protein
VDDSVTVVRFPESMSTGWSYFDNAESKFTDGEIESRIAAAGGPPPSGVLLIEVFYNYDQQLNLPLFNVVNPIPVYSYAIMPLSAAEPTPVP